MTLIQIFRYHVCLAQLTLIQPYLVHWFSMIANFQTLSVQYSYYVVIPMRVVVARRRVSYILYYCRWKI